MTLEDYLAVPYVVSVEAVQDADGTWLREASYPELGCVVRSESLPDAFDELDRLKTEYLSRALARGEALPVPRPPLRHLKG